MPPITPKFHNNSASGGVLFLILIAVALFAALSYAVTSSTRSGGGDASKETIALSASQIVQYVTSIENAIMRIKISNNCDDTQISFENPIVSGYTNSNAPADYRCHVFRPEGGNVSWQNPPQGANDGSPWVFSGGNGVPYVGTSCGSTTCWEMVAILPNLSSNIASALSLKLNNTATIPKITSGNGLSLLKWTGSYLYSGWNATDGATTQNWSSRVIEAETTTTRFLFTSSLLINCTALIR